MGHPSVPQSVSTSMTSLNSFSETATDGRAVVLCIPAVYRVCVDDLLRRPLVLGAGGDAGVQASREGPSRNTRTSRQTREV